MWGHWVPRIGRQNLNYWISREDDKSICWRLCVCVSCQSCPTVCDPMDCSPLGSSVHGILQANSPGLILHIRPMNLPNIFRTVCPNAKEYTFFSSICGTFGTTDHILGYLHLGYKSSRGKLKNTGAGSHSWFQGIFLTQELSLGLLHCRQIVYHLSHHRSLAVFLFFFS